MQRSRFSRFIAVFVRSLVLIVFALGISTNSSDSIAGVSGLTSYPKAEPSGPLSSLSGNPSLSVTDSTWPPPVVARSTRCSTPLKGSNNTINVGPGKQFEELTDVGWLDLEPGDVVNIFYRAKPYRTKVAIRSRGTADAPIVINGVTNKDCIFPEVSGKNAVTAADAAAEEFFSEKWGTGSLAVFYLYKGPNDTWGHRPAHIQFQNLKITGAHQSNKFTNQSGRVGRYDRGAAGIYAVVADDITIDNCEITGNGNGVFFNSKSADETSHRIIVRNSKLYGNGNVGSYYEHNLYIQVARSLYEGNYVGQLIPGARGSSLKDRSSATVIRFNHIDAAARAIDLVESEGGIVVEDPLYHDAWVYGNLIISDHDRKSRSSSLLIHWGGDNDPRYFRTGTLNFFHNTVAVTASQKQAYYVSYFDLPEERQSFNGWANVLIHNGTSEQWMAYESGRIVLSGNNWLRKGWGKGKPDVSVRVDGATIEGSDPKLDENFIPLPGSPIVDQAQFNPAIKRASVRWAKQNLQLTHQYDWSLGMTTRTTHGKAADLGAFEAQAR